MPISSLHILVVEDDQGSRDLLHEMISYLGHEVVCVATAEEALEPLANSRFDTLIADINLPGMSGIALAEKAMETAPGMKIVFASGYSYLVTDKTDFAFTLLPKPFNLSQLRHAIEAS
jgi:DNA-binding NtrC family response regulator